MTGASVKSRSTASLKRGRPPKYGQPGQVVAITLPVDVVEALRAMHSDLGWAIVSLVEKTRQRPAPGATPEAQLVGVGAGQALIVIDPKVFRPLPGVRMVPLSDSQAFLALEPGRGLADLELTVGDRIAIMKAGPERRALARLLDQLRKWRRDRRLNFDTRSIILVHRAKE
jgi:hypothetical protein